MAQYTQKVYANRSTYVDSGLPNTNFCTSPTLYMSSDNITPRWKTSFFGFDDFQVTDKKKLESVNINIYTRFSGHPDTRFMGNIKGDTWKENELTYNLSMRITGHNVWGNFVPPPSYGWTSFTMLHGDGNDLYNLDGIKNYGVELFLGQSGAVGDSSEVQSTRTTYVPYLNILTSDVMPFSSNCFPSKFVDKKTPTTFSWTFDYDKRLVTGTLKQASAKLRYRAKGVTPYTEVIIKGETNSYTVPANTFTTNDVEWQVIVTSDDNVESTKADWITVTTIDSIPTCSVVSPNGSFIDGTVENTFYWKHIVDTGSPQTKYDLQYFYNNIWVDLKSEVTSKQNCVVLADTLPAGNIQWRVRTYNTDNVASVWCVPANIVVRSSPVAPSIVSITNQARPVITWQSVGQEAIKLEVVVGNNIIYQTGVMATNINTFKIPVYLDNGSYSLRLCIINCYGLESKPTISPLTINVVKPNAPTLTITSIKYGAKLNIVGSSNIIIMYVLRDGIAIKKLINISEYFDYSTTGTHSYVIRAIDINDNYVDSLPVTATTIINSATIAPVTNASSILELKSRRGELVTQSGAISIIGGNNYFAGREYPVFEFSQHTNESKTLRYSFTDSAQFKLFEQLVRLRKTILYRNKYGECFYGVIASYDYSNDKHGIDFSFTLQKVDYVEEIKYDLGV